MCVHSYSLLPSTLWLNLARIIIISIVVIMHFISLVLSAEKWDHVVIVLFTHSGERTHMGLSWEGEMRSSSSSIARKSRLHLNLKVFISILLCHDCDIFFWAQFVYKCDMSTVFRNFLCVHVFARGIRGCWRMFRESLCVCNDISLSHDASIKLILSSGIQYFLLECDNQIYPWNILILHHVNAPI